MLFAPSIIIEPNYDYVSNDCGFSGYESPQKGGTFEDVENEFLVYKLKYPDATLQILNEKSFWRSLSFAPYISGTPDDYSKHRRWGLELNESCGK